MAKMLEVDPSGQTLIPKATYLIGPRGPEYRPAKLRAEGQELRADEESGNRIASAKPRKGAVSGCDIYGLVRAGDNGTSRHRRRPELVEGFVGSLVHTSEDETGLIYMRARWMDPSLGRFISEDPALHGLNWYVYCDSNPVVRADATGRFWHLVVAGLVGGLIGGVLGGIQSAASGDGFAPGFWGGFVAGGLSTVLPMMGASALVPVASALGAMVTAAMSGQDWGGVARAGGWGFAIGLGGYLLRLGAAAAVGDDAMDGLLDDVFWCLIGTNGDLWGNVMAGQQ